MGKRLKAVRDLRQLSQSELERKSEVPAVMISQFETGLRKNPSAATLKKLADALSISMDYLLGRTEQMDPVGGATAVLMRTLARSTESRIHAANAFLEALESQENAQGGATSGKAPRKKGEGA